VSAIEFAIGAPLLFLFMLGIVNLGDLAMTDYAVNNGIIFAARAASIEASNGLAASSTIVGNASICPTTQHIQDVFDAALLPGIGGTVAPTISMSWGGTMNVAPPNGSGCAPAATTTPATAALPGGWVTVSATYTWMPIAVGFLFGSLNLTAQATDQVLLSK